MTYSVVDCMTWNGDFPEGLLKVENTADGKIYWYLNGATHSIEE